MRINHVCDKCGGRWLPHRDGTIRPECPWCQAARLEAEVERLRVAIPKTRDGVPITLGMDIWKRGWGCLSNLIFHRQVAGFILDSDGWCVRTHSPGNPDYQTMTYPIEVVYSTKEAAEAAREAKP